MNVGDIVARGTETKPEAMTRGVHHLALTTEDMKMTVDFYVNVLGMRLVLGEIRTPLKGISHRTIFL